MKKVLHVGCGQADLSKLPKGFQDGGWEEVRFDIDPAVNPDIIGTMLDMMGVPDNSMDALYSSHNIEHVYFHQVVDVLKEFKRTLKPEGFCIITCPDIKAVAKDIVEKGVDHTLYQSTSGPITANDIMYGHSASIADGHHYMAHKTGFDLKALADRLDEAKFAKYYGRCGHKTRDLWFVAFKQTVDAEIGKDIFQNFTAHHAPSVKV